MMMKNILSAFAVLGAVTLSAQDIHFSQTTETPLLINPSQAGLGNDVRAHVNYKDQWRSVVSAPYKTVNAGADFSLLKGNSGTHMGIGVNLFNDKAGDAKMTTSMGQLHLSGVVAINTNHLLSVGLVTGYAQRSMNNSELTWGNQYDGQQYNPGSPTGEPANFASFNYLDIGAGASWFFATGSSNLSSKDAKIFNIGFSVLHINQPKYSFYGQSDAKLPMKIVAHGNASIGLKNTNLILFRALWRSIFSVKRPCTLTVKNLQRCRTDCSSVSVMQSFQWYDTSIRITPLRRVMTLTFPDLLQRAGQEEGLKFRCGI
jgi:type IX secretion system PorP/SprF family membrane protein